MKIQDAGSPIILNMQNVSDSISTTRQTEADTIKMQQEQNEEDNQVVNLNRENYIDEEANETTGKELIKAIEEANKKIRGNNKEFEFSVHEKTKQIMIKVLDTKTKKVLKEFPPEKILDMVANMCELAGLFVDEKR